MLGGLVFLVLIFCVIKTLRHRVKDACERQYHALRKALFWDSFIRYIIEGNLDLCYENIFFVHLYSSFDTQDEAINTGTRIAFVVVLGFWLIWSTCFITRNRKNLKQEELEEKFGSMYEGIKTKKLESALYTPVFCLRRMLVVLALLFLKERDEFAMIYAFLIICSANFVYLTMAQANTEVILNRLEILNELGLIGVLYTMLFFIRTNTLDALVVWDAGVGTIAVLGFVFLLNFGYMFSNSVRKLIKESKEAYMNHQKKKAKRMKKYRNRVTRMTSKPKKKKQSQKQIYSVPVTKGIGFDLVDEMVMRNEVFRDPDQTEKKPGKTHEELYGQPEPNLLSGKDAESGSYVKDE